MNNTFRILNLEIYRDDSAISYTYSDAIKYIEGLGNGWRFPYLQEMIYLFDLDKRYGIIGFRYYKNARYWVSSIKENYIIEFYTLSSLSLTMHDHSIKRLEDVLQDEKYNESPRCSWIRTVRRIK